MNSPYWHSSIYKEACHQLNEEHVSEDWHSSIELEEHLVNQVLKVEDGRFAYIDDALVLVAHILIIRTSTWSSLGDDSLRLKICKGYSRSHCN